MGQRMGNHEVFSGGTEVETPISHSSRNSEELDIAETASVNAQLTPGSSCLTLPSGAYGSIVTCEVWVIYLQEGAFSDELGM